MGEIFSSDMLSRDWLLLLQEIKIDDDIVGSSSWIVLYPKYKNTGKHYYTLSPK